LGGKYSVRSSEAAIGRGGAQRPVLHVNEPKKEGCAQRTGAHARPKPTSAENSFASRFGCFEHKLVSRDTLLVLHAIRGFRMQNAQRLTDSLLLTHKAINTHFASC
jgi:hypothetical protein